MLKKKLSLTVTTSVAALLLIAAPGLVGSQSPQAEQHQTEQMQGHMHGDDVHAMHEEGSMMDCQQMQAKMLEMQAKQKEMQSKLDELVQEMNATSGAAQQQAMAELLTSMVEQRASMHDMMAKKQPMMMQHMMAHMHSGETGGMSDCPMMKSGMMKGGMHDCPMMKGSKAEQGSDDLPERGDGGHH